MFTVRAGHHEPEQEEAMTNTQKPVFVVHSGKSQEQLIRRSLLKLKHLE